MREKDAIELLKGMQGPLQDYADMVGAPAWAYGHQYVYSNPEDYALEEAINALEEKQKWIPVAERLPGTKRVLITDGEIVKEGYCRPDGIWKYGRKEDELFFNLSCKGIIAWMPLPEPYRTQD